MVVFKFEFLHYLIFYFVYSIEIVKPNQIINIEMFNIISHEFTILYHAMWCQSKVNIILFNFLLGAQQFYNCCDFILKCTPSSMNINNTSKI